MIKLLFKSIGLRLRLAIWFLSIFFVLAVGARLLGSTQPPNPALRGFIEGCEDKPQPCWYGIVPEITTRLDAANISEKLNFITCRIQFEYSRFSEAITAVELQDCNGIYYGDLASQFNFPFPQGIWPSIDVSLSNFAGTGWPFWKVVALRIAYVDA